MKSIMKSAAIELLIVVAFVGFIAPARADNELPWLKSRTLAIESPEDNMAVWAHTFYADQGNRLMTVSYNQRQSDIYFDWKTRTSDDNGQTWSDWKAEPLPTTPPAGVHYTFPQSGWVDPVNGRMLMMVKDGVFPTGNPSEMYYLWELHYRVSTNGGRTFADQQQVIQQGGQYTSLHPAEGVNIGYNSMMSGATATRPIRTKQGKVLVPVAITHDKNGHFDSAVLIGTWGKGDDTSITWDLSERVTISSSLSTRGVVEPVIAEMPNGDILMVCRGSNQNSPSLPARKWYSVSRDDGKSWSDVDTWTFDDGSDFYSPSSCSQLLKHSNGKYYWLGNISPTNAYSNSPRYPLVIAEVNPDTYLLEKDTLVVIDTLSDGDNTTLQLSNFFAYEDRVTGDIVLQMTRFTTSPVWNGNSYVYRIAVPVPEPSCGAMLISAACGLLAYVVHRGVAFRK